MKLPDVTEIRKVYQGKENFAEWFTLSAKGLIAFDWNYTTKQYEIISVPMLSLTLDGAGEIGKLADRTQFDCCFVSDFPGYSV